MWEVEEQSGGLGSIILLIELLCINSILNSFFKKTFNLHPAICLVIDIIVIIAVFIICMASKIIRFIVALGFSIFWFFAVKELASEFTSDKIWLLFDGGIAFLISFVAHISLGWTSCDYIIRKR